MGKKRSANDRRRVRGMPGQAPAERERRLIRHKERELRAGLLRLRALDRVDYVAAVDESDACFREVRRLAVTPKGLVSDEFRKELWPFLLGESGASHTTRLADTILNGKSSAEAHRDAAQVEKDVERSLWHYDVLQGMKESERRVKRQALMQLILHVLDANDELFYFQGYHDIVSVFLLTLGTSDTTLRVLQKVSETYHRETMREGLEHVMSITRLLFPLLNAADELLVQHLHESGVEPYFALPWMITWFAHQLKRFEDVARLFDVFLVTHPLFSLYVSAAVCLESREAILRCECDFGTMHGMLSNLPLSMDIEKVIARALVLFHQLPPTQLQQRCEVEIASTTSSNVFTVEFPYEYQPWPSVTTPMLEEVLPLPPRRSSDGNKAGFVMVSWQVSTVVAAVSIGVMGVASAYFLRDQAG
uniref:Rab-GAP TBC domain-containing protein n=1 Tax=Peronospora matthiolae TaxID=2874970 RepID=A0AAV1VLT2_9STRA